MEGFPVMAQSIEVFCCFVDADAHFLVKLKDHFARHTPPITFWDRSQIPGGANTQEEIARHFNSASFFLMLLSAQFLGNNYCYDTLRQALNQRKRIIPVLVRPVDLSQLPTQSIQTLPRDQQPVSTHPNQEIVLLEIAQEISRVIQASISRPKAYPSAHQSTSGTASYTNPSSSAQKILQQPPALTALPSSGRSAVQLSHQLQQNNTSASSSRKISSQGHRDPGNVLTRRKAVFGLVAAAGIALAGIEIFKHFTDPLYNADWSKDMAASGWSGSTVWQVLSGMLVSSNNNNITVSDTGLITCPFSPPTPNYAVEASIGLIKEGNTSSPGMGIFVRGDGNGNGYWLGYSGSFYYNSNYSASIFAQSSTAQGNLNSLKITQFSLDDKFHTWRVEAKDDKITVLLDGIPKMQFQDTNYLAGKQIGLFSSEDQVQVQSFKVFSL